MPGDELDWLGIDLAHPHFWTRQIGHDRYAAARVSRSVANAFDHFTVPGKFPVRKIQARHVETGTNQPAQHFRRLGSRTDGGDDLRFVRRQRGTHAADTVISTGAFSRTATRGHRTLVLFIAEPLRSN